MKKAFAGCSRATFEELAREASGQNDTVINLRNEEAINDEVLRRIQRDIDLAEARLHDAGNSRVLPCMNFAKSPDEQFYSRYEKCPPAIRILLSAR